ncbi:type II CAAX prenyl endopeptidase Rce1 family protein [Mucilaginibacter sp. X4EP1]|uniref:CPBP family intramembrane glutamic endopeptidase n=1 Tax=Mucilaginibacter sp. X4EP1 TaxID=2723092 RepID=UPI00216A0A30|nr:CPBP family intramembrane glutamic endopeptidase [Mucilaginibacter sp. X4EP1]MCS3813261.1 membrane protease YdiL (CAAX protease family) [Mucilaginibacter sp. X4EP1]
MSDIDVIEEPEFVDQGHCFHCSAPIDPASRFCKHCGSAQPDETEDLSEQKWLDIKQVILFFLLEAAVCGTGLLIKHFKTLGWSITLDIILAINAIVFFGFDWYNNKPILKWRNFSVFKLIGYCVLGLACSLTVNFFVSWLNFSLYSKDYSYYEFYRKYQYGKELTILFVAIMPALFEELAFRGFLLGKLLLVVDKKQAIFISAFLFAIMHMSVLSLVWLVQFALLLAYVRIKENTLWYGVFIHFFFNFTACVLDFTHAFHHHLR